MKTLQSTLLLLTFFCFSCTIGNSDKGPTKESLSKTIKEFNRAFSSGNVAALVYMIADDYKHTNGSSRAIKAENWVNYLHKRSKDLNTKDLVVHSYDMDQIEIVMYDDTAIVTGRVQTSTTSKGIRSENEYRVTHVWVYENERWKRAGFHDGKIK